MKFRPCIDLHDGKVKQIVGSTLNSADPSGLRTNFVSSQSPAYFAAKFKKDGLTGGHVIMLGPGNEQGAAEALASHPGALCVGGGINSDNAVAWLEKGAKAVIVSSYLFDGKKFLKERLERLSRAIGRENLVVDVSCRMAEGGKYFAAVNKWQTLTDLEVNAAVLDGLSEFCAKFLIHAIEVEGKGAGPDIELLKLLSRTQVASVTYAGGLASLEHIGIAETASGGRVDFTVGSALDIYGGTGLKYADLVRLYSDSSRN